MNGNSCEFERVLDAIEIHSLARESNSTRVNGIHGSHSRFLHLREIHCVRMNVKGGQFYLMKVTDWATVFAG